MIFGTVFQIAGGLLGGLIGGLIMLYIAEDLTAGPEHKTPEENRIGDIVAVTYLAVVSLIGLGAGIWASSSAYVIGFTVCGMVLAVSSGLGVLILFIAWIFSLFDFWHRT
jgi:hypothetical protein